MKTKLLIMITSYTQTQSKKEIEEKLVSCATAKDFIQNIHTKVSAYSDSLYISNENYCQETQGE